MAITIYDVARLAGVGIGTVSRVLNKSNSVKESTRKKVLAAIEELNFTPDPIARSMTSGQTDSVGVIVPFFTRPFFIEVLRGIESALGQLGKELVLYNVENNAQRDNYFTKLPMRRKVEGILIISLPPDETNALSIKESGMPTVLVDGYNPMFTSLVVNNIDGAYHAVSYLIKKGHRRIGFINGIVEGNFKFNQANDRLIGVHRALNEAGLSFEPELVTAIAWGREDGKAAGLKLLNMKKPPTAIFVASDLQALGVLEAAKSLGITVPEQLSIMGYDGIELSELLELSTIQQPMFEMGTIAVNKLFELIKNPDKEAELIRFNTRLVERKSTGARPIAKMS
jgi:DNA-binding LacI/PurR family transcriptional regulator